MQMTAPFTIVSDTREQLPWSFLGITRKVRGQDNRVEVPRIIAKLGAGDYSIEGHEDQIAIERKSVQDFCSTLTHGRRRFVRELERLQDIPHAYVIVEGNLDDVLDYARRRTCIYPQSLAGTIVAWSLRYKVQWVFMPNREWAERWAFKLFERYWQDLEKNHVALENEILRS